MSDNKNVDIWIAGAFAAFTVDLIVYPLDTIKTRLQSPVSHLPRPGSKSTVTRTWEKLSGRPVSPYCQELSVC